MVDTEEETGGGARPGFRFDGGEERLARTRAVEAVQEVDALELQIPGRGVDLGQVGRGQQGEPDRGVRFGVRGKPRLGARVESGLESCGRVLHVRAREDVGGGDHVREGLEERRLRDGREGARIGTGANVQSEAHTLWARPAAGLRQAGPR